MVMRTFLITINGRPSIPHQASADLPSLVGVFVTIVAGHPATRWGEQNVTV